SCQDFRGRLGGGKTRIGTKRNEPDATPDPCIRCPRRRPDLEAAGNESPSRPLGSDTDTAALCLQAPTDRFRGAPWRRQRNRYLYYAMALRNDSKRGHGLHDESPFGDAWNSPRPTLSEPAGALSEGRQESIAAITCLIRV